MDNFSALCMSRTTDTWTGDLLLSDDNGGITTVATLRAHQGDPIIVRWVDAAEKARVKVDTKDYLGRPITAHLTPYHARFVAVADLFDETVEGLLADLIFGE
jgi:hypothetical protein